MSETVHYKGIATKIEREGKTAIQIAEEILSEKGKEMKDYYDDIIECLTDNFYQEYFYHKKTDSLYHIKNSEHDLDDEIIVANKVSDNIIEYELRYYNGGAGFEECLEEAFNKIDDTEKATSSGF